MCGVLGMVRSHGEVAPDLYAGSIKLQHRAHDMSGITTYDGEQGRYWTRRGMGEVASVFSRKSLERLKGSSGIGHVRWTTVGDRNLHNAHPFAGSFRGKKFYIGHNGQLTDLSHLNQLFSEYRPDATTDTKFIAALISSAPAFTFEEAIQYACFMLKGTYALVILFGNTVYGVRDVTGNRPLVVGSSDNALIIASESVTFNPLNGTYIDEVARGEIVAIRANPMNIVRMPIRAYPPEMPPKLSFCLFEMIYLLHPASIFLGRTVKLVRERMGRILYEQHPLDADIVIGVPDSGLPATDGYARASGIPEESGIIRSHYSGRIFIEAVAERTEKHRIKHDVVEETIRGKRVIVIDDSIVEGPTARKIIALLRQKGATHISFLSSAPLYMSPCFYGVATAWPHRSLIAADCEGNVERIREKLGADYLGFCSVEGTIRAVIDTPPFLPNYPALTEQDFCTACFTGNYPIPISP